jgi:hypothetical protein
MFSRVRAQHTAGVLEMAGWLARGNIGASVQYYGTDRLLTNLLVARVSGTSDTGAIFYNPFDSNYLASCGTVIQDWTFNGGHVVPPTAVLSNSLTWLVSNRVPAGLDDRSNALAQANDWQARITANQRESVLRECVSNLMIYPRSWFAYQAQLTLDQLMTNYTAFRSLNVSNLAQGDFASDLFYHYARGAALNADWSRYNSCMKALTGVASTNNFIGTITNSGILVTVTFPTTNGIVYITTTNDDRAGDVYSLLTNYNHYPSPQLQFFLAPATGQLNFWLNKDTPGLAYLVQSRSNLVNDAWRDFEVGAIDTATFWSASVNSLPETGSSFVRIRAAPALATSPPWTFR